MREIGPKILEWRRQGNPCVLGTLVRVYGSAPRPLGARIAVSPEGEMVGSVSGGCVEGAVVEESRGVLETGEPRLVHFGITDEQAWTVGLSCGGEIEVFLERLPATGAGADLYARLCSALEREEMVALVTLISGPGAGQRLLVGPGTEHCGDLGALTGPALARARSLMRAQKTERIRLAHDSRETEALVEVFPPPPCLIIVGAVHVAIRLVGLASRLGFRTRVVDPRTAFATAERFAEADELIPRWPQEALSPGDFNESTYLVTLSHDEKIDNPALLLALQSRCRYIGALGSRKTHARRVRALAEMGATPEQLERIHAPVGLPLGGRRPEEIALSILAQMVAVRNGREEP